MYEPLTVLRRTPSASAATAATPSAVPAAAPCRQAYNTRLAHDELGARCPARSTSPTQPGGTVTLSRSSPAARTSRDGGAPAGSTWSCEASGTTPRAPAERYEVPREARRGHIDFVRCDEVLDGQRRHGEAVGANERHEEAQHEVARGEGRA